jgi:hypothetical protein
VSAMVAEAPDTNRSAGLHSLAVLGSTQGLSSSPTAGLTCGGHLRAHVRVRNRLIGVAAQAAGRGLRQQRAGGGSGTWSGSKTASRESTAQRMRAFLLANATTASASPRGPSAAAAIG